MNEKVIKMNKRGVLNIVHFNDVYEIRESNKPVCGGVDRFCFRVKELREKYNPVILFSGDLWNPSKCMGS